MALVPCQVLRAAILLSYCSILCNYKAIDMPAHQTYGGSWKFLTFIDLVIQAVFFGICVLTDLSSLLTKGNDSQEQERQLKKLISLRDWVMAVLAFPVGVILPSSVVTWWLLREPERAVVQLPPELCSPRGVFPDFQFPLLVISFIVLFQIHSL
ncbi:androgen-induced gene 1 protein isoform X8 [Aquila chrysaetos chrysaetos]|uniref:androgen-induced gene 1 protein isoform X8 n=1 Tax=Aquila chrysaetos chrysaetos TaxID=223781 RepID=UPI0011772406|nr:androgen-induced gene 1 protein isoform X8 [Aquila chrysaetos chrysaetos]